MGLPIVLSAIGIGLQIASGFAQSRAERAEGEATDNYYQYLANQNEQQALLAKRTGKTQSRAIQDIAKVEGRRLKLSQVEFRASQRAALAASGVPLSSVTAEDIQSDTFNKQAMDEATLRYNADVRSYEVLTGASNEASSLRSQAGGFRLAGQNAVTASRIRSRNTLLSTAASVTSPFIFRPFLKPKPQVS